MHKLSHLYLALAFGYFVICDGSNSPSPAYIDDYKTAEEVLIPDEPKDRPVSIRDIVARMALYNCYDAAYIGLAAQKSDQYGRYELLLKYATDKELFILMKHPSRVVRAYCFDAICKRQIPGRVDLFYQNMHDAAQVETLGGCTGETMQVNFLYYSDIREDLSLRERREYDKTLVSPLELALQDNFLSSK